MEGLSPFSRDRGTLVSFFGPTDTTTLLCMRQGKGGFLSQGKSGLSPRHVSSLRTEAASVYLVSQR